MICTRALSVATRFAGAPGSGNGDCVAGPMACTPPQKAGGFAAIRLLRPVLLATAHTAEDREVLAARVRVPWIELRTELQGS